VLVTLAIAAIILGEATEVNLVKLITGAVLIAGGAMLVGNSWTVDDNGAASNC
jgi:hypothetical protein